MIKKKLKKPEAIRGIQTGTYCSIKKNIFVKKKLQGYTSINTYISGAGGVIKRF